MDVKQQIQEKTAAMMMASPSDLTKLAQDLQRLRVAMLTLKEIVEDVADPNTYKELALLNKMMTGHDPEAEALREEQERGDEQARERLDRAGLKPEQAGSMVRVLEALRSVMEKQKRSTGGDDHLNGNAEPESPDPRPPA